MKNKSISFNFNLKLTLIYTCFFLLLVASNYAYFDYLLDQSIQERELDVLNTQVDELKAWYYEGGVPALKQRFQDHLQKLSRNDNSYFIRVVSPRGDVVFFYYPKGHEKFDYKILDRYLSQEKNYFLIDNDELEIPRWHVVSVPLESNLFLQVGTNGNSGLMLHQRLRDSVFKASIPFVFLCIIFGYFITDRSIRPIKNLLKTLREIIQTGQLSRRVKISKNRSDLEELGFLFNQVLERNENLLEGMRNTLDHVAHDLKTPMTRFRASIETTLGEENPSKDQLVKSLHDCMEESEDILKTLNTLMDVAEAETGVMQLQVNKINLSVLLKKLCDLYEFVAEEKNIQIVYCHDKDLFIHADEVRLQQALANILDNSIKYNKENGYVHINAEIKDNKALISIKDSGIGIASKEQEKVWRRLYRVDSSRTTKGLGLGLNLVDAIIKAHKGKIILESKAGYGAEFIVELPLHQDLSSDG